MYHYKFTSTIDDLRDAEAAERAVFLRAPFHGAIVVLGSAWLAVGLFVFLRRPALQPLMWICLGAILLYYFVWRPRRRREQIVRNNRPSQAVMLEWSDGGLNLDITGVGQFTRQWDELAGITDTRRGILFYFTDGRKNWLPSRVFPTPAEKKALLEFIKRHQTP